MFHRKHASSLEAASSFSPLMRTIVEPSAVHAPGGPETHARSPESQRSKHVFRLDNSDVASGGFKDSVTRVSLARAIADRCGGLSLLEAKLLVDDVLEEMLDALARGQTLKLCKFGTFVVRMKNERPGRNPRTGAPVPVRARKVVVFKASATMKAAVNAETSPDNRSGKSRETPGRVVDLKHAERFRRSLCGAQRHEFGRRQIAD
jgi:integration host factor subunit alpha